FSFMDSTLGISLTMTASRGGGDEGRAAHERAGRRALQVDVAGTHSAQERYNFRLQADDVEVLLYHIPKARPVGLQGDLLDGNGRLRLRLEVALADNLAALIHECP